MINELKRQYQKNLMLGTVISAFMVLFGAFMLVMEHGENVIISSEDSVILDEWPVIRSNKNSSDYDNRPKPAISIASATDFCYASARPFQDFGTRYKDIAGFMTIEPDFFKSCPASDFDFGVGSIVYLPEYDPGYDYYLNEPIDTLKKKPWPIRIPDVFYNSNIWIKKNNIDQPVVIRNLFVERPENKQGIVGLDDVEDTVFIRVTIDSQGQILGMETIYENPPDLGFAERFKEALANAYISPFKKDGRHEGGSFLVYCIFSRHGRNSISNSEAVTIK